MRLRIPFTLAMDWRDCGKAAHGGVYKKIVEAMEAAPTWMSRINVEIDATRGEIEELIAETKYAGWFQDGPYIVQNRRFYNRLVSLKDAR